MHCLSINSSPSIATHTHSLATTPLRLNVFAFSFFKFCFLGILVFFSLRGAFFFYYSPSFQRLYYTSDLPLLCIFTESVSKPSSIPVSSQLLYFHLQLASWLCLQAQVSISRAGQTRRTETAGWYDNSTHFCPRASSIIGLIRPSGIHLFRLRDS